MGLQANEQVALLTDYDIKSAYSAAYHTAYANIRFNWDSEQNKQHAILLVTPDNYPGHTVATANIAIAAALNGTPTLLIDTDLRTSDLHRYFESEEKKGVSDLIAGDAILPETIASYLHQTFIPGLQLLSAGTTPLVPYDTGRLLSVKLAPLLAALRQFLATNVSQPGIIIFTSPPVLAGIDAAQLSALADQTYLLIANGRTTRTQTKKAHEQLQRAHAKVTGIIMLDI